MAAAAPAKSDWRFIQCFGEKTPVGNTDEADIISSIQYSPTGEYLATGDRGGRIVIFEKDNSEKSRKRNNAEYKFYAEFQSHEPEFDYLKSVDIEEKINMIRWCRSSNGALYLLSTNDKTVKLWKICEKRLKAVSLLNVHSGTAASSVKSLRIPQIVSSGSVLSVYPRRVFGNGHTYHINSISVNSSEEFFLSADDLRVNLWHFERADTSFNVVDIKPENMENLTEVITAATFHPVDCSLFIYGSSKGSLRLCDMRLSSLCDTNGQTFVVDDHSSNKGFFSEIVSSVSDVRFSGSGKYILCRDYMTVKIWDVAMNSQPVHTIAIHDHLNSKLADLYENEYIFDKFELTVGNNDSCYMSGSYNNTLHAYSSDFKSHSVISLDPATRRGPPDAIDFTKRILQASAHPTLPIVAIAGLNCLYIYAC